MKTTRRRVASNRNSEVAYPMEYLDWSNWWVDEIRNFPGVDDCRYLHVRGHHPEDPPGPDFDTWHRVYCRATNLPRLQLLNGVLYWLISK